MMKLLSFLAFWFLWATASCAQGVTGGSLAIGSGVNPCADVAVSVSFLANGCYQNTYVSGGYSAITGLSLSAGTITGSGAQVWVPDSTGTLQAFASGVNKITNAGLILYGAAYGNSQIQSNALTNAAWTHTGQTLTANSTDFLSPDGTNDYTKILVSGTSAVVKTTTPYAVTSSQTRVASVYIHAGNQNAFILQPSEGNSPFSGFAAVVANASTCAITSSFAGTWTLVGSGAVPAANGGCRIYVVYTLDAATTTVYLQLNPGTTVQSGNTGFSAYAYGAEDTAGSVLPPYVSTAAAAASVTADSATLACPAACISGGEVAMATYGGGHVASIAPASSYNLASATNYWAGLPLTSLTVSTGTVPLQASQHGYNTLTFMVSALDGPNVPPFNSSTVDTGCTGNSGYLVYCANYGGWGVPTFANSAINADGSLTVGGGANQFNGILTTAIGAGTNTARGFAAGGGFYAEETIIIPVPASGNTFWSGWPSAWHYSMEASQAWNPQQQWTGQGGNKCHVSEIDDLEMFNTNFGYNNHQYQATYNDRYQSGAACFNQTYVIGPNTASNIGATITVANNNFFHVYHKYGLLWIPAAATGTGLMEEYLDDVLLTSTVETWAALTGTETPPPTSTSPWLMGVTDGNPGYPFHYPLIMGSGYIVGGATTTGSTITGGNLWTVGTLVSGTIVEGQTLSGAGIGTTTCFIASNASGSGSGSTWNLNGTCANVAAEPINSNGAPNAPYLQVGRIRVFQASDSGNMRGQ